MLPSTVTFKSRLGLNASVIIASLTIFTTSMFSLLATVPFKSYFGLIFLQKSCALLLISMFTLFIIFALASHLRLDEFSSVSPHAAAVLAISSRFLGRFQHQPRCSFPSVVHVRFFHLLYRFCFHFFRVSPGSGNVFLICFVCGTPLSPTMLLLSFRRVFLFASLFSATIITIDSSFFSCIRLDFATSQLSF